MHASWNEAVTRRHELTHLYLQQHGFTVQRGPFKGLVLPSEGSWSSTDLLTKLMGVYELELHSVIEKVQQQPVDIIINIGCAEGYYAIGAAKAFPTAKVFAFDLAESSQKVCALCARENGVEDRVKIGGLCTPEILHKLLEEANYGFVIVDIEGAEKTLLDIEKAPTLSKAHILVECHDFSDHSITPTLTKDFSYSHAIDRISEGARDPNLFNFCRGLNSLDRWIVMCEFRAMTMHWLSMRPLFGNI